MEEYDLRSDCRKESDIAIQSIDQLLREYFLEVRFNYTLLCWIHFHVDTL